MEHFFWETVSLALLGLLVGLLILMLAEDKQGASEQRRH
jgi:hypothetical protein